MQVVSDREMRNEPGKVREALAQGDVVVTSRGRPYAIMIPVDDPSRVEEALALSASIRAQMAVSAIRRRAAEAGLERLGQEAIEEEIRQARAGRKRLTEETETPAGSPAGPKAGD
jgi:PHD/YefM family antitoxin component YafN of YafNO toxin-antitoxin module